MRESSTRRAVGRVLATWAINAVALMLLAAILDGLEIESWAAAFGMAALLGILNALVWPLLIRFALRATVLTLGLGVLVLNGLLVWWAASLDRGVRVDGLATSIVVAFGLTVFNTVATTVLAIDDDDFYYRNVIRRQANRLGAIRSEVPALFFLEIDGLAHDVLVRAVRDGNVPTLARWLSEGTHRLMRWECDWSSQTGASQAGILHGTNEDIPAFRWWEKESGQAIASSAPKDVMALERRVSNGRGLLHADGASRANMFSGDAPHSLLTMSTVLRRDRPGRIGEDYFSYFANPYSLVRTVSLVVVEVVSELWQAAQQSRRDVRPRVRRGVKYSLVRAWTTVVQRDLQVAAVIGDIYSGRPVCYTTFTGYDEVAHHSGIERYETLKVLLALDRQLSRLELAAAGAPRPIRFVVLSDHGQTQGATFRQRYGHTLEQLVTQTCEADDVEAGGQGDEGWMYLGASVTEAARGTGVLARGLRSATKRKRVGDAVVLGPASEPRRPGPPGSDGPPEVVVLASGCLGLISFPREPGRVTLERISELYPRLIPTLREHPGIGFLLVRSATDGAIVLGARGVHFLDRGHVEGEDPLEPFGPNAARHVKRTDRFPHCADIMLNSTYWPETGEVAAFEELVGSHGGLGGSQSFPFALAPTELELPEDPVVGASELHTVLRRWLAQLGHAAYRDERPAVVEAR